MSHPLQVFLNRTRSKGGDLYASHVDDDNHKTGSPFSIASVIALMLWDDHAPIDVSELELLPKNLEYAMNIVGLRGHPVNPHWVKSAAQKFGSIGSLNVWQSIADRVEAAIKTWDAEHADPAAADEAAKLYEEALDKDATVKRPRKSFIPHEIEKNSAGEYKLKWKEYEIFGTSLDAMAIFNKMAEQDRKTTETAKFAAAYKAINEKEYHESLWHYIVKTRKMLNLEGADQSEMMQIARDFVDEAAEAVYVSPEKSAVALLNTVGEIEGVVAGFLGTLDDEKVYRQRSRDLVGAMGACWMATDVSNKLPTVEPAEVGWPGDFLADLEATKTEAGQKTFTQKFTAAVAVGMAGDETRPSMWRSIGTILGHAVFQVKMKVSTVSSAPDTNGWPAEWKAVEGNVFGWMQFVLRAKAGKPYLREYVDEFVSNLAQNLLYISQPWFDMFNRDDVREALSAYFWPSINSIQESIDMTEWNRDMYVLARRMKKAGNSGAAAMCFRFERPPGNALVVMAIASMGRDIKIWAPLTSSALTGVKRYFELISAGGLAVTDERSATGQAAINAASGQAQPLLRSLGLSIFVAGSVNDSASRYRGMSTALALAGSWTNAIGMMQEIDGGALEDAWAQVTGNQWEVLPELDDTFSAVLSGKQEGVIAWLQRIGDWSRSRSKIIQALKLTAEQKRGFTDAGAARVEEIRKTLLNTKPTHRGVGIAASLAANF